MASSCSHARQKSAFASERMRGWAGFRTILVHEYLEIDHAIAYRAIRNGLGDLDRLMAWVLDKLDAAR
jgi:uncharacterized protein YutE (UPF0331/DUF86 family)